MKTFRLLALAASLAAGLVGSLAAAHTVVIYTYTYNSTGPYAPKGEPAAAALEIVDAPATAVEGDLHKGDIIARRQVRAYDAVVLDAPVQGAVGLIPAGAVLVRVNYQKGGAAWCDISPGFRLMRANMYDCLEDQDGGVFKRRSTGYSATRFQGFERSGLVRGDPLPTPAPFHRATPAESPIGQIGYRYCNGDDVSGPPRFAVTISPLGQVDSWSYRGECAFGVWTKAGDRSAVDVDGLSAIFTTSPDGGLRYRFDSRLPAGMAPTLSSTGSADPVTASRPGPAAGSLVEAGGDHTMVLSGAPPTIINGQFGIGQSFARAGVRHGVTGVLQNQIRPGMMWRADTPVEVGQPVFGIVTDDRQIIWCAPRIKPGQTRYETACFLTTKPMWWIPHREPALMPWESLYSLSQTGSLSSVPSVIRRPITLPPMTLTLVLAEVRPPRHEGGPWIVGVDWTIDWGDGPQRFRRINYETPPAGPGIDFFGTPLRFRPTADGAAIVVNEPGG